jgi:hypothetical protein
MLSVLPMHYSTALSEAARRFNSGARSFPLGYDATFTKQYTYKPPNKDYERFLFARLRSLLS